MIIDFIASVLFGIGCHQLKRVTRGFPGAWENIGDHAIGGTMLIIATPYWYHRLGMGKDWQRVMVATVCACVGTGAGVVVGWLLDDDK
jgi:hypothetical protein